MTPRSSQACWSAGGRNAPAETNSRKWPPSCCVDAAEQTRPDAHRQVARDRAQPVERARAAALVDLALDRAPEQVEDLRHDHHRGHPVVAQRIEDHARVAAPDVQDVGADVERVVQPDGLLEQVRQRQQRDDPVLHRRHDPVERLDRGDDVVVGQHHALRRAGRARREDELEDLVGGGRRQARLLRLPVGRERRVVGLGFAPTAPRRSWSGSGRARPRADRARRGPSRGSGGAALGRRDDPLDRLRRHAQVERHEHEPRGIAPK